MRTTTSCPLEIGGALLVSNIGFKYVCDSWMFYIDFDRLKMSVFGTKFPSFVIDAHGSRNLKLSQWFSRGLKGRL